MHPIELNCLPIDITDQIIKFRDFLVAAFPHLMLLMDEHDWDDDMKFLGHWERVNWEFLVERELLGKGKYLTPLYIAIDPVVRMTHPGIQCTHSVVTKISTDMVDARITKLVPKNCWLRLCWFLTPSKKGKGFGWGPPFEFAKLALDKKRRTLFYLPIEELKFYIVEYPFSIEPWPSKS